MGKIKILDDEVRNKIAAGEVIQNPKGVVKELIENALDADAQKIEIEINQGGKEKILVSDNGVGMDLSDALLSVNRYATSKILDVDDLSRISTYGFRGEALASIGAVSKLIIETRARTENIGTKIVVAGGELKEVVDWARDYGTTVSVFDLFYNFPVRRNFLKSTEYEKRGVVEVVHNYILTNPTPIFKLTADGKILFQFESVKDYRSRVRQLFPKSFSELILFEEAGAPLSVTGFLQQPVSSSRAENFQSIFVNQRPVQHRAIYRTILDALGNPQSRPNFILYIKSDPEFVDVNIHPAKTEIKFRDERYAQDFIFQAIKKNLKPTAERVISLREGYLEYPTGEEQEKGEEFWQLHNTYIIAQTKNGMIVVDQHVAHERIIFETILKNKPGIQRLLFPVIVELNAQEFETFKSIKDSLAEMGIEAKEFSANVIVIDTLPAGTKLNRDELKNLFVELSELKAELIKKREEVAKVIACKTAIKAGDRLTPAEMQNLIDRLFACENPYLCPHGRPTVIKFSLDDLAHRFGRT